VSTIPPDGKPLTETQKRVEDEAQARANEKADALLQEVVSGCERVFMKSGDLPDLYPVAQGEEGDIP